jgi:hypothetical protein
MKTFFGIIGIGCISLLGLVWAPLPASAQTALTDFVLFNANDIDFEFNPQFPLPNQQVTIRAISFVVDLNRVMIEWRVDGRPFAGGVGVREITLQTKGIGENLAVEALVYVPGQSPVRRSFNFAPADAIILWEAVQSYTPPFYRGKALPGEEGLVKIVILPIFPNDIRYDAYTRAVYIWDRNGVRQERNGGFGRSTFMVLPNVLRAQERIDVTVSDRDNRFTSTKTVGVQAFDLRPQLFAYEPTEGLRFNVTQGFTLPNDIRSIQLIGEPFFFDSKNEFLTDLGFDWIVQNRSITLDPNANPRLLNIDIPSGRGTIDIRSRLENTNTIFQEGDIRGRIFYNRP